MMYLFLAFLIVIIIYFISNRKIDMSPDFTTVDGETFDTLTGLTELCV